MPTIQQITEQLKARLAQNPKREPPEEIERLWRNAMQRNLECLLDCPICGGLGFVKGPKPSEKMLPCPNRSSKNLYLGERYGLTDKERELNWNLVSLSDTTREAVEAVQQTLKRGSGWVYLWGPPGLAKTLILKIAVAVSLQRRIEAAYTRMTEIIHNMIAALNSANPSEESQRRLDWWAGLPLLAIDEFDWVLNREYAAERRFLLMDRRYERALRAAGSVTLMASNNNPANLDGYLYDRINDGRFQVVHMVGGSMRPVMGWKEPDDQAPRSSGSAAPSPIIDL